MTDGEYEFMVLADDAAWLAVMEQSAMRDILPSYRNWDWYDVDRNEDTEDREYRVRYPNEHLELWQFWRLAAELLKLHQALFIEIKHGKHVARYGLQPDFRKEPYVGMSIDSEMINKTLADRIAKAMEALSG